MVSKQQNKHKHRFTAVLHDLLYWHLKTSFSLRATFTRTLSFLPKFSLFYTTDFCISVFVWTLFTGSRWLVSSGGRRWCHVLLCSRQDLATSDSQCGDTSCDCLLLLVRHRQSNHIHTVQMKQIAKHVGFFFPIKL